MFLSLRRQKWRGRRTLWPCFPCQAGRWAGGACPRGEGLLPYIRGAWATAATPPPAPEKMALSQPGHRCHCLWALGGLPVLLVLLLGQPAQGWVNFRSPMSASRLASLMWPKQGAMLYRQAVKVLQMAMDHLNEKHNTTYSRAPGVPTHIMLETVFGRTYHVNVVLVEAKCPEGQAKWDSKDCKVAPDAPKLECRLEVTMFLGNEEPYIKDDGCETFKQLLPDAVPDPEGGGGGDGEEEAAPFI
ncbi:uncharacterized protein LOC121915873 [Sceloporus undulatus]|uniref:uncharacterized protein LOC121915873 n=1 Tax=Sceloporus undulatus TaxID=8520 RepID=UPI001C4B63AB|nr:uncharacterized protein LOC121915873 [Sceloporus undulatus]